MSARLRRTLMRESLLEAGTPVNSAAPRTRAAEAARRGHSHSVLEAIVGRASAGGAEEPAAAAIHTLVTPLQRGHTAAFGGAHPGRSTGRARGTHLPQRHLDQTAPGARELTEVAGRALRVGAARRKEGGSDTRAIDAAMPGRTAPRFARLTVDGRLSTLKDREVADQRRRTRRAVEARLADAGQRLTSQGPGLAACIWLAPLVLSARWWKAGITWDEQAGLTSRGLIGGGQAEGAGTSDLDAGLAAASVSIELTPEDAGERQ